MFCNMNRCLLENDPKPFAEDETPATDGTFFFEGLAKSSFFHHSYLCKTQNLFLLSYFHIYTFVYWANAAPTLGIAINGTFSMNILYVIMQRNTTKRL